MLLHTVLNTILFKGRLINRYFQIDVHFEPIHPLPKDVTRKKIDVGIENLENKTIPPCMQIR